MRLWGIHVKYIVACVDFEELYIRYDIENQVKENKNTNNLNKV